MTDRDPATIARYCRKAATRRDLSFQEREMLAGYARFYEVLADGHPKQPKGAGREKQSPGDNQRQP